MTAEELCYILNALKDACKNIDVNILKLIAEYAIGCTVSCCNSFTCHQTEIRINNIFEFARNCRNLHWPNANNYEYYWYSISKSQPEYDIERVYGLQIRSFCRYCAQTCVLWCLRIIIVGVIMIPLMQNSPDMTMILIIENMFNLIHCDC